MNVVIVGNGLAGTMAAKALRDLDKDAPITIFAAEGHPYYPRPNLIEFLAGRLSEDKLFAFPPSWAEANGIDLRLETPVRRIHPPSREVEIEGGRRFGYDRLLLADGASAAVPPIPGAGKPGVLTLRTIDDARTLIAAFLSGGHAVVLGGGLLGLEIARALAARGGEVDVVEIFPYLLPRQLDPPGAKVLRSMIESAGVRVRVGAACEEIIGGDGVTGVRFKGGDSIDTGLVVIAAGIRPNTALAAEAGLNVGRGVLVDDGMATNAPGIYAAGDGAEHRGRLYGIIPASFAQARVAADNIAGREKRYEGTIPSNQLKVAGLALLSVGIVQPEGEGFEEFRVSRPESGIYKKIVLRDGILAGAIWMGTREGAPAVAKAVAEGRNVGAWKGGLLEDAFDFARL